jgi:multiple sugar transport system substrate-binding protein
MRGGTFFTRREFLRVAAGAAAVAATGAACGSGSDKSKPSGTAAKGAARRGERTLRIAQFSHFVPTYDQWFDDEYTKQWGEEHNVEVLVDHIPLHELPARAAAEVAAGRGHDLFQFTAAPPAFEDDVIDHREIVEEVEAKLGKMTSLVERSVFNPKTNKYFGFSDSWVPNVIHYRTDLWDAVGRRPDLWDDVLAAAPKLKAAGHPVGIDMSASADFDSNWSLMALMSAYGSAIQGEEAKLTINSPATVEAVRVGASLYQTGMTDEVFTWDGTSNNRHLASGKGSLILNAISAIRAIEAQDPELAAKIGLLPAPDGPAGRHASYIVGVYVIWNFAENPEPAKQFLVDFTLASRQSFLKSELYNFPSFTGAVPDLADVVRADTRAQPPGKYGLLAQAPGWSTNVGHPGSANAAVDEVFNSFLVPKMFAAAARGEMSSEEAVKAAEAQMNPIFEKWRERGKI